MRWICSYGRLYCSIFFIILFADLSLYSIDKYVLSADRELVELSEITGYSQIGTTEKNNKNDGDVEKYLSSVGLKKGNPYCAAGQYWCFLEAANILKIDRKKIPIPPTGLANEIYNYAKKNGKATKPIPIRHDLIIWRKGKSIFGHTERIIKVKRAGWVRTIAFNVLDKNSGKEGVFIKQRNIYHPLSRMRVRGLVGFN